MKDLYTCEYCKLFTTTNSGAWGRHEQNCWANSNSLDKYNTNWYCQICNIRFLIRDEFTNHNYNNHMNNKKQKCSYCYKEWLTTDLWRLYHEEKCQKNPDKIIQIKCSYCNRNFNSQDLTNEHELICHNNPIHYEKNYTFSPVNDNNPNNIGVYKIVSPSGKVYIGMTTKSFKKRWNSHYKDLRNNRHKCKGLQNAFNKYGWEQLEKIIIDEYIQSEDSSEQVNLCNHILLREQELWDTYKITGYRIYNDRPTASGSVEYSDEHRLLLSNKLKDYRTRICPVYYIDCIICNKLVCSGGNQTKYCKGCRPKSYSKKRYNNYKSKYKNSKICKYDKCCNFIVGKNSYCSKDCEKLKKNEYYIYIPKDELYDYYINQLWSTTEIAEKYNSNHTNVQNKLKEYGIPLRDRTEGLHAKNVRAVKKNVDRDSLIKLLQNNVSKQRIYDTLNITPKILKNAISYYNLEEYLPPTPQ